MLKNVRRSQKRKSQAKSLNLGLKENNPFAITQPPTQAPPPLPGGVPPPNVPPPALPPPSLPPPTLPGGGNQNESENTNQVVFCINFEDGSGRNPAAFSYNPAYELQQVLDYLFEEEELNSNEYKPQHMDGRPIDPKSFLSELETFEIKLVRVTQNNSFMATLKSQQISAVHTHLGRVRNRVGKKIDVTPQNASSTLSNIVGDLIKFEAIIGTDAQYQPEEFFKGYL